MHLLPVSTAVPAPSADPGGTSLPASTDEAAEAEFMAVLAEALATWTDVETGTGDGAAAETEVETTTAEPDLASLSGSVSAAVPIAEVGDLVLADVVSAEPAVDAADPVATSTNDASARDAAPLVADAADVVDDAQVLEGADVADDAQVLEGADEPAEVEFVDEAAELAAAADNETGDLDATDDLAEAGDVTATDEIEGTGEAVAEVSPDPVAPDVASGPPAQAWDEPSAAAMREFTIPRWILAQYQEEQAAAAKLRAAGGATVDAVAAPVSTQPPAATNAVVAPAPSTSPTASDPALLDGDDPWQQLATVIRPLRQMADGSHRISLQLRPAELGTVHLEVALEDGTLSIRAVAETAATRDVLAASLPELRAELTRSGIDLGSVDVGDQATDGSASGDAGSTTTTNARSSIPTAAQPQPDTQPLAVEVPGRLDLSL